MVLMTPTTAHIEAMKAKAIATLSRTDGVTVTDAEFVKYDEDRRYSGQYVILRDGETVAAVYKVVPRFGPAKGVRDEHGIVNYVVDSMSIGVKRIKRAPKGLI